MSIIGLWLINFVFRSHPWQILFCYKGGRGAGSRKFHVGVQRQYNPTSMQNSHKYMGDGHKWDVEQGGEVNF